MEPYHHSTKTHSNILCQCIDTSTGTKPTPGGLKPTFIMRLHSELINEPLIKFLGCDSTTPGSYKVHHNTDFAKLYRLAIGTNPTKRFSEAHKLLSHFCGEWFIADCERALSAKNEPYLKVTKLRPQNPIKNDAWTAYGMVIKAPKKRRRLTVKTAENLGRIRGELGENSRRIRGEFADDKTLQPAISLGLEPVFNQIQDPSQVDSQIKRQVHVPKPEVFFYSRLENETTDDFHNRVIDESFFRDGITDSYEPAKPQPQLDEIIPW